MTIIDFIILTIIFAFIFCLCGAIIRIDLFSYDNQVIRLTTAFINRMEDAMKSLGYDDDEIDQVIKRMGEKDIPTYDNINK